MSLNSGRLCNSARQIPSASGERQMFPKQTKSTDGGFGVGSTQACWGPGWEVSNEKKRETF